MFYDNLRDLIDQLIDKSIVREKDILREMEDDLLFKLELVNKSQFIKKRIQVFTKTFYK